MQIYATLVMFKGCENIYAIEPNIVAFQLLKENVKGIKNIFTFNIAVSSETKEKLYLHKSIKDKSAEDKILKLSQGSSLLSDKTNIGDQFYEVQGKCLFEIFNKLDKIPTVIKCDIEGGEYLIYKQLIKCAKSFQIRKIFVECHATKYPQNQTLHDDFMNLIKTNKLENKKDISWH